AYDTTGRRIAVSQRLPGSPDLDHLDPFATPETPTDARQHGKDIRVLAVPMPDGLRFVIGQPNAPYRARIRVLQLSLAVGLPILLLLGGALGVVLAKPALRPVGRVADAAEAVGEAVIRGDSQLPRLTPPDTQDEVRQLTDAFNDLLARLEIGFERERGLAARQRAFLADAAHELRTPIAIVRSEADAALASPTGTAVERAVLVRIAAEADRMGRLVSDLLLLARSDGERPSQRVPLYLDDLAEQSLRRIRALPSAAGRELRLGAFEATPIVGDPPLLERAIVALLENALIHGGTGRIDLEVVPVGSQARLTVRDHGQGIPPDARELVFERFSRLDPERPGTGLGLAIARWIASHHDGTLSVEEASPGARFVLTLPLAPHGDTNLSASA
ncbi:MAG TPA: HAMP domain-containing sensor histidine kinase, partial [Gemmatimonadales bacterium]|nr:HAMP domain-containing sensor histidine kinase [Gemmatimonadales bacterium]